MAFVGKECVVLAVHAADFGISLVKYCSQVGGGSPGLPAAKEPVLYHDYVLSGAGQQVCGLYACYARAYYDNVSLYVAVKLCKSDVMRAVRPERFKGSRCSCA